MDRQYQSVPYVLQPAHAGPHGGAHAAGYIAHVDPRLRILAAVAASILIASAQQFAVLGAALAAAVFAWTLSGLSPGTVCKRLLPLNVVLLLLVALLPLSTRGTPLLECGPLNFSREGFLLAGTIAVKGNAILLMLLVLLGTMDATTLGHALNHLHVPDKLSHLLLFTVRYIDVLHRESLRLRAAMRVRGFRPRVSLHTYRSYGHLVGMLLVRSFDRAERIVAAMKCRGFRGHFYLLDHFAVSRADLPFAVAAATVLLALGLWEWV
jgi:cobalt/nickel transport system permease protein